MRNLNLLQVLVLAGVFGVMSCADSESNPPLTNAFPQGLVDDGGEGEASEENEGPDSPDGDGQVTIGTGKDEGGETGNEFTSEDGEDLAGDDLNDANESQDAVDIEGDGSLGADTGSGGAGGGGQAGGESGNEDASESDEDSGVEGGGFLQATCETSQNCPGLQVCKDGFCEEPPVCLSNEDCLGDRVCSRGICADEPFGCQLDSECFGGYCNTYSGKCANEFPCIEQSGCAFGVCDGASCVECQVDQDCPIPSVQSCLNKECMEPESCNSTSECLGGNICAGGACIAPIPAPDLYEPNNVAGDAPVLEPGEDIQLTLGPGGKDWYRIAVVPGISPLVRVEFDDTYGDLDMRLYEVSTGVLMSRDDNEAPYAVVGAKGQESESTTLFLEISHVKGVVGDYSLTLFYSEKGFCMNDAYDLAGVGDDKELSPVVEGPTATLEGGMVCPGDVDWWRIVSAGDLNVTGEIVYPYMPDGELQLSLQRESDEVSEVIVGKNGKLEWVSEALEAGEWFLKIEGSGANVQSAYELTLNMGEGESCAPDSLEPNDASDTATELQGGEVINLSMCEGDSDWFKLIIPPGQGASFRVEYPSNALGLTGVVYGEGLEPLDIEVEATPLGNEEVKTFTVQPLTGGGTVLLHLSHEAIGNKVPSTPYFLEVEVAMEPCEEEDGEDNGTQENATEIPVFGIPVSGGFCGADYADWYSVGLGPGDRIALEVAYEAVVGQLLIHLYSPGGKSLAAVGELVEWGGGGVIQLEIPPWWDSGLYKLLLTGPYSGNYEVLAQKYPGELCLEEVGEHEPNNSRLTATWTQTDGTLISGVCGGDPDVYGWNVGNAASADVSVKLSNPGAWANLSFTNRWGTVLAEQNVFQETSEFSFSGEELNGDLLFLTLKSGLATEIEVDVSVNPIGQQ